MPVLVELAAWGVTFAVFCLAWMLLQGYRVSLGLLLGKIADETKAVVILGYHPFRWLGRDIDKINHFILYQLGQVVARSSNVWHAIVGQMAAFVHETMDVIADLADATAHEFWHLRRWAIPTLIAAATGPLAALYAQLFKRVDDLVRQGHHTSQTVTHVVTHDIPRITYNITGRIVFQSRAAAIAATGGAIATLPRIGRLERELKGIDETLRDALRRASPAVLVGVVAATVARLGLSWARCSGAQRYGRNLCRMDRGLLESLIADTLIIASTLSLVEFAGICRGFTDDVATPLRFFLREVRDLRPVAAVSASDALARFAAGRY